MAEKRNIVLFGCLIVLSLSYWLSASFLIGQKPSIIFLNVQITPQKNPNSKVHTTHVWNAVVGPAAAATTAPTTDPTTVPATAPTTAPTTDPTTDPTYRSY